ncbi:hypothetical protein Ahy_A10g050823 isoform C [Arachis hypogaea]|uniref:Uncharacterized protein n=1 Tax=Arachis hypogaea TaxID=3818 RepID=A0A445BAI9_ARAHY|nr:hypothetical protein Ahy_A10g050823 isoform C [Arachis hypogaea]
MKNYGSSCDGCLLLEGWVLQAAASSELLEFGEEKTVCGGRWGSTWRTSNAIQASTTAMFITLPTEAHSGEPPPPSQPLPLLHSSCSETCRQAEVLQIKLLVVVVAVVGIERRFLREPPRTSGSSPSTPTTPVTPQVTGLAEQPFIMVLIP